MHHHMKNMKQCCRM